MVYSRTLHSLRCSFSLAVILTAFHAWPTCLPAARRLQAWPDGTRFHVVQVRERDGTQAYRLLLDEEYQALTSRIAKEAAWFDRALRKAQRKWTFDRERRKKIFPKGDIYPLHVTTIETLDDYEEAESLLADLEEVQRLERDREQQARLRQTRRWDRHARKLYEHTTHAIPKRTKTKRELRREAAEERLLNRYKVDARRFFQDILDAMIRENENSGPAAGAPGR